LLTHNLLSVAGREPTRRPNRRVLRSDWWTYTQIIGRRKQTEITSVWSKIGK